MTDHVSARRRRRNNNALWTGFKRPMLSCSSYVAMITCMYQFRAGLAFQRAALPYSNIQKINSPVAVNTVAATTTGRCISDLYHALRLGGSFVLLGGRAPRFGDRSLLWSKRDGDDDTSEGDQDEGLCPGEARSTVQLLHVGIYVVYHAPGMMHVVHSFFHERVHRSNVALVPYTAMLRHRRLDAPQLLPAAMGCARGCGVMCAFCQRPTSCRCGHARVVCKASHKLVTSGKVRPRTSSYSLHVICRQTTFFLHRQDRQHSAVQVGAAILN